MKEIEQDLSKKGPALGTEGSSRASDLFRQQIDDYIQDELPELCRLAVRSSAKKAGISLNILQYRPGEFEVVEKVTQRGGLPAAHYPQMINLTRDKNMPVYVAAIGGNSHVIVDPDGNLHKLHKGFSTRALLRILAIAPAMRARYAPSAVMRAEVNHDHASIEDKAFRKCKQSIVADIRKWEKDNNSPALESRIRKKLETFGVAQSDLAKGLPKKEAFAAAPAAANATGAPPPSERRFAWIDLDRAVSRIDTSITAFMAAAQQAGLGDDEVERLVQRLAQIERATPAEAARLAGSMRLVDNAALLYAASRQKGGANPPSPLSFVETAKRREDFVKALARDALQQELFSPLNLEKSERARGAYFDGNALVNVRGKTVADLAGDPVVLRLKAFASLGHQERAELVRKWLDAHGQDTQYRFGTAQHSMASVLKATALARGQAAPGHYVSHEALADAFADLCNDWRTKGLSLIDPLMHFGLHFAKTSGVGIEGTTPQERLAGLRSLIHDVFVVLDGPPASLEEDAGAKRPNHPWFAAKARMLLRFENMATRFQERPGKLVHEAVEPLTQEAIHAKVDELVRMYRQPFGHEGPSGEARGDDTTLMHWLKNTPILSMVVGFGEGVAKGDVDEIVSSVPVVGNLYNIYEGLATGDTKRAAMAAVTLVPFAGSVAIIADGIENKDAAEIVGGLEGLGLDFITAGEGHLLNRMVGHSALGKGRVARTFAHLELPPAIRLQAEHSLGAMKDLGIGDRAIALSAKSGEHGTAEDPFNLAARELGASPQLTPEMAKLVERLKPVPAEDSLKLMLRRAEDGTWKDPKTLAQYARIGPDLYRLAEDPAKSVPGRPLWNPTDPNGHGRDPRIRLEYAQGQWQVAEKIPSLDGGAPEAVRRPMNLAAAEPLDLPVPEPYATGQRDFASRILGNPPEAPVRVSQTKTVYDAVRILTEAADLTKHKDFSRKFDAYFDFNIYKGRRFGTEHEISSTRDFYAGLYQKSETFRALFNQAERLGYLGSGRKWFLHIGEPWLTELNVPSLDGEGIQTTYLMDPAVNIRRRHVFLPTLSSPAAYPFKFIVPGGQHVHLPAETTYVHEMVHVLTNEPDPIPDTVSTLIGLRESNINVDGLYYLGERGAVEYLAQRIMEEADITPPKRLTYLALDDESRTNMAPVDRHDYEALENYVKLQDTYIGALFPSERLDKTPPGEATSSGNSGSHKR